jgi:XRE family transcriptional regulator, master regulator for biofilm formation
MIGKKITTCRENRGLSITELSRRSGLSTAYIRGLEKGTVINPAEAVITKLARVLYVDPDFLENKEHSLEDEEWQHVMYESMCSGVTKEELREFIEHYKKTGEKLTRKSSVREKKRG